MVDVANEFQVQGLEIDWAIVAWDIDFRYSEDGCKQYQWMNINKEKIRRYQINAYRVILTRTRRGMAIYGNHPK